MLPCLFAHRAVRALSLFALATLVGLLGATEARAQVGTVIVVNSAADTADGACDALGQGAGNQDCTLREAIGYASTIGGMDTIQFDIPSGASCSAPNVCRILLGATLQINFENHLVIDGLARGAKITLDGGGNGVDGSAGGVRIIEAWGGVALDLHGLSFENANGGAVFTSFATMNITRCTFANNYLNGGGAAIRAENREVVISNCTFYRNTGTNIGAVAYGGASVADMTITHSTFALNRATFTSQTQRFPANVYSNGRTIYLRNSLLSFAGNGSEVYNSNCAGGVAASTDTFADDGSCGSARPINIFLEPLADNGGPTRTMAPTDRPDNLAIGNADATFCESGPVNRLDQRGYVRPSGGGCDAGAVELGAVQAYPPSAPTIGAVTAGDGEATVLFAAPDADGGVPITGYTITSEPAGIRVVCLTSPCVVPGLTNGVTYRFTVTATNAVGQGAASAASDAVIPDRDECLTANGDCGDPAFYTCINQIGASQLCLDIDECAAAHGGCDPLATCTNELGAPPTCGACPSGYTGDGVSGCVDVDECATDRGGCAPEATCTNVPGSATCACDAGYEGDGRTCTVISDGGVPGDGGVSDDAGGPDVDAGTDVDGGADVDGGVGTDGGSELRGGAASGCGCVVVGVPATPATPSSLALAVLGAALVRRAARRRRGAAV